MSAEHERDLDDETRRVADEHRSIDDAPIVVDARQPIGIRGDEAAALAVARALILQAAALHGPADLRIVVVTTEARRDEWEWTEWLPHTHDPRAPTRLVAADDAAVRDLVEQLLAATDADEAHTWVVVDDATLVANRTMPVRQLLRGRARASVAVIGRVAAPLPSLCHTVIDVAHDMTVTVAQPSLSVTTTHIRGAGVSRETATVSGARLARFTDPEAADVASELPASVRLRRLLSSPSGDLSIGARWADSRRANSYVVPIGVDGDGPLMIDLVHDGPHVLVAGTTGAGKSELLRTLITSLAATVDAQRVNFLLVDYKGGSAFDRCGALPHTVGVVTDLDARLTARALACLEAELRRREEVLRDAGVDDIATYHRRVDPPTTALPRLVVVVDEFAALMSELPRFVDALIDVGQRGRSLGVHIVLATQRPSGVVNDALRANTNLRISLRVLDQHDSRDVIGVPDAAAISRHQPGRAIARVGAAELVTFQTASVSGHSRRATDTSVRIVETGPCAAGREPASDDQASEPVCDLASLVDAITTAHRQGGYAPPRRPWPDPLPDRITLDELDQLDGSTEADDGSVAFGLADVPHEQRRVTARWHPAIGPLLVHSLRGGGATTTLATIAIDLARHHEPERVHLYVLDLGAGDLAPLVELPHCGAYLTASETERQTRLLGWITDEIRERSELSATDRCARPAIVVIVDNLAALGGAPDGDAPRDALRRLVSDGAGVGVHLVASTDRAGALGHATDALVAQRVVMRLAEPADYSMIGARGVDPTELGPGRGFALPGAREVQIALPHHRELHAAVAAIVARGARRSAAAIAVLPSVIALDAITTTTAAPAGWLIGLLDRTLGPALLELAPGDHALIAGPARSGKSNALALIVHAAQHAGAIVHVVAPPRSPLSRGGASATLVDDLARLVDSLIGAVDDETSRVDGSPPHVIVVDDADLIDDGGHLERLLATRPLHVHVVASARADRLRASYRHWTTEVRRSRIGVLLRADDVDGELLGVRLPRGNTPARVAGRGYLVTDHGIELVQLARHDGLGNPLAPR